MLYLKNISPKILIKPWDNSKLMMSFPAKDMSTYSNFPMVLYIMEKLGMEIETGMERKLGLIKLSILENGGIMNPMGKESSLTLLVTITKDRGSTPKPMVKENL